MANKRKKKLSLDSIGDIDAGALRIEFNKCLMALCQDLHDRPYLEKARVLVLKVGIMPKLDKQAGQGVAVDDFKFAWEVDPKLPKRGSMMTVLSTQNDGTLVFDSDVPDAGDEDTIFEEAERQRLQREERERARVSNAASGDAAAVERQAQDGK